MSSLSRSPQGLRDVLQTLVQNSRNEDNVYGTLESQVKQNIYFSSLPRANSIETAVQVGKASKYEYLS